MKKHIKKVAMIFGIALFVFLATIPVNQAEGDGQYLSDFLNITRSAIVSELTQNASGYKATQYEPGPWASPSQDTSYNGSAGMNCGGFVAYAIAKVKYGTQGSTSIPQLDSIFTSTLTSVYNWSNYGYSKSCISCAASNWYNLIKTIGVENRTYYVYDSKEEMLAAGKAEKGDILYFHEGDPLLGELASDEDNHMGFFWGDTSSEDLWWESRPSSGNRIAAITPKTGGVLYLIKLDHVDITVHKVDDDGNSLSGVQFRLCVPGTDEAATDNHGWSYGTNKTDSDGNIYYENIPIGTYELVELETLDGYEAFEGGRITIKVTASGVEISDENGNSVPYSNNILTITNKKTETSVTPTPKKLTVTISKKDLTNQEELPGAKIEIRDENGDLAKDSETSKELSFVSQEEPTTFYLAAGKYTLKETAVPSATKTCLDNLQENEEKESCNYQLVENALQFQLLTDGTIKVLSEDNEYYKIDGSTITIYNDRDSVLKVPDTGASRMLFMITMGLLAIGSGSYLVYQDVKRKTAH